MTTAPLAQPRSADTLAARREAALNAVVSGAQDATPDLAVAAACASLRSARTQTFGSVYA